MNRLLLPLALIGSTAACATILDFQEPVDRVTAASEGTDAGAPEATSTSSSGSTSGSVEPPTLPNEKEELPVTKLTAPPCSCVPSPASGWMGPFVVAEAIGSEPPKCTVDYPREAYFGRTGWSASPTECTCACGTPTDVACSVPVASFFADATCSAAACHVESSAVACVTTAKSFTCDATGAKIASVAFGPSLPSGGKCAPSASTVIPDVSWKKSIRLCAPETTTAAGCDGGVCQPTPSPVFAATNRCIMKGGDVPCPAAYPERQLFQSGGTDGRGCSPCACDAPASVACAASPSILTTSCRSTATEPPSGCVTAASNTRIATAAGTPQGGGCSATGGAPTGAFIEGPSTTVCCLE